MSVALSWSCHALVCLAPNSWDQELSADISFVTVCTSNHSVRILKKARGNIILKWYYFEEIVKIVLFWKKISSLFKYSERTVTSTVTNNISAESSWSQLLGARQTRAWHDQEGVTPTFRKGHWEKKQIWQSKFRMQKKKFLMQFLIFFCYELIVCPLIFKSNKVYFASSLIAKPTGYT